MRGVLRWLLLIAALVVFGVVAFVGYVIWTYDDNTQPFPKGPFPSITEPLVHTTQTAFDPTQTPQLVSSDPTQFLGTPGTANCSGIEEYVQELRAIRERYRAAFIERLPGVQPDWELTGGVDLEAAALESSGDYGFAWTAWSMQRSKAQYTILAELWADRVDQLRALHPPPVAQSLQEELISGAELLSSLYRNSAEMGWLMATIFVMLSGDDGSPAAAELSHELAGSCPAWAAFQAESLSPATPVPG